MARRESTAAALALLLTLGAAVHPAAEAASDATAIKATFLQRFASFVAWPPDARSEPAILCVLGPAVIARAVEQAAAAHSGRTLQVRRISEPEQARECNAAYLASSENDVRRALREVADLPVLTVTDSEFSADLRGVIHFVVVDKRVRFHIDDARASSARLEIDSRLLALAVSVRRRGSA